jgi:hypothetical protein
MPAASTCPGLLGEAGRETMSLDKEHLRCLRILAARSAQLEWPCRNSALPWLIDRGYAEKVRDFQASWNNRPHNCAEIAITDKGRQALQQTPGA